MAADVAEKPLGATALLRAWGDGDQEAGEQLMSMLYQELRRRAALYLRRERRDHILQPTALVHEAFLRLVDQRAVSWQNRIHFLAIASQFMRRVLVDHARRRKMEKRSGRWIRVELDGLPLHAPSTDADVLALDDLLKQLAEFDVRKSRVVELRYFGGLSLNETAHALGVSPTTVDREWRAARAWLYQQLKHEP
jgi:RNA polymerase sigma factor (TIGR02999 family)